MTLLAHLAVTTSRVHYGCLSRILDRCSWLSQGIWWVEFDRELANEAAARTALFHELSLHFILYALFGIFVYIRSQCSNSTLVARICDYQRRNHRCSAGCLRWWRSSPSTAISLRERGTPKQRLASESCQLCFLEKSLQSTHMGY
jgi:hypothetical protein